MFLKFVPSLVIFYALWGSYATPDDGLSSILSRIELDGGVSTAVVLGTDSSGHTSYSLALEIPVVTTPVSVATAPDATLTPAATLVAGSTDAHLSAAVTVGSEVVSFNEDCGLNNDSAVCTLVAKNPSTTFMSRVTTITVCTGTAWPCPSIVTTGSPSTKNGAGRMRAVSAGSILVVFAAAMLQLG